MDRVHLIGSDPITCAAHPPHVLRKAPKRWGYNKWIAADADSWARKRVGERSIASFPRKTIQIRNRASSARSVRFALRAAQSIAHSHSFFRPKPTPKPYPSTCSTDFPTEMYVVKLGGQREPVRFDKITARLQRLSYGLSQEHCDPVLVAQKVCAGIYMGVSTSQLDELAAETAAAMTASHPDYALVCLRLSASRSVIQSLPWYEKMNLLFFFLFLL